MNKKILFLGAIISSCVIAFISGQTMADYNNWNMSTGGTYGSPNAQYSTGYSSSQCAPTSSSTRNPYPAYTYGYNSGEMGNTGSPVKPLQTESTEKYQGTVSSLNKVQYPDGNQVEMVLETNEGTKRIMLGPSRFIDQARVKIQSGDKVTVTGYRMGANGNEVIVAQEVNKNGNVLQLRDEQRQPMWQMPGYAYSGQGTPGGSTPTSNPHPYSPVNRGY